MAIQSKESRPAPLLLYLIAGSFILYIIYNRLSLYLRRRQVIRENDCKPVRCYPYKDPFFALDVMRNQFRIHKEKKILETSVERYKWLGNTYATRMVNTPVVMTIEPENVKTVLSLRFKDYSLGFREYSFSPLLGHGIFNTDGENWASSRHLLRPNFARDQIADIDAFERHLAYFFKAIPTDGSTVDLQDLFFKLTIDSATEFLFNHSVHSLRVIGTEEHNQDLAFAEAFKIALGDALSRWRMGALSFLKRDKKSLDAIKLCHEYVDRFVDDAIQYREKVDKEGTEKEEKYVFLHELAKATKDKQRIRDELLNVLLAGRDTTAGLLSNLWFQLAKRPDIYAKLREEVAPLNGLPPTYEQLREMKYTRWCLNESLRLHPVVPGNSRIAIRDTLLPTGGGPEGTSPVFIKKGTLVGYSPYSMHRRTDYYGPDASDFKPERWEKLRPGWEYLPFNGGPRICLGQQYALTEASYVTTRIVQRFARCESREPGPWVEELHLTLSSGNGTKVGLVPQ